MSQLICVLWKKCDYDHISTLFRGSYHILLPTPLLKIKLRMNFWNIQLKQMFLISYCLVIMGRSCNHSRVKLFSVQGLPNWNMGDTPMTDRSVDTRVWRPLRWKTINCADLMTSIIQIDLQPESMRTGFPRSKSWLLQYKVYLSCHLPLIHNFKCGILEWNEEK